MEMQKITKEGERNDYEEASEQKLEVKTEESQKKGAKEMQEVTKEGGKNEYEEASEPKLEVKTEEEAEPDHYSKLQSPSEDVYSEALYGGSPVKTRADKQTDGNARLYRAACLFLTILCVFLLLIVMILGVKLSTGSTVCPDRIMDPAFVPTCSQDECQALFPTVQHQQRGCMQCATGWLTFGRSCFYMSTTRLSWDESQKNCSSRGGALAVVSSRRLQDFLTKEGQLSYWIGLRHTGNTWSWVDNTELQDSQSYWADVTTEGGCGILRSAKSPEKNWEKASCKARTYFICQLQL